VYRSPTLFLSPRREVAVAPQTPFSNQSCVGAFLFSWGISRFQCRHEASHNAQPPALVNDPPSSVLTDRKQPLAATLRSVFK